MKRKPKDDAYCCGQFEDLVNDAGKRGISIVACEFRNEIRFVLQMRAVDHGVNVLGEQATFAAPMCIQTEFLIVFCPICGAKLAGLVRRNQSHYQMLVKDHEHLEKMTDIF